VKFSAAKFWRITHIALWLGLIGVYTIIFFRVMASPEQRTGSDFIAFYSAGRIAQESGFSSTYNLQAQHQIQQRIVGFSLQDNQILLYNHLPFLLPLLALIAIPNYLLSFFLWQIVLLTLMIFGLGLFLYLLPNLEVSEKWAAALFFPLFFSLLNGQDTALALFALAAWMFFLIRQQDFLAGLALALLTVRPHWFILFCVPFIFQRRRIFAGAVTGAAGLTLFSAWLLGWQGIQGFLHILSLSAGGEWYGMKENAMFNFLGILSRAFPANLLQARVLAWVGYFFSILATSLLWKNTTLNVSCKISWQILAACFFSPHLHFHDLSILVFSLLLHLSSWKKTFKWKVSRDAVLLLISLALVFSQALWSLRFWSVYLLMALLSLSVIAQGFVISTSDSEEKSAPCREDFHPDGHASLRSK